MKGVPEGIPDDPRAPIPRSTLRAAAIASVVLSSVVALCVLGNAARAGNGKLLDGLVVFIAMPFPLFFGILYGLALLRGRADSRKRGGPADPFG